MNKMLGVTVYHRAEGAGSISMDALISQDTTAAAGFLFQSCQRTLAVFPDDRSLPRLPHGFEVYSGEGAYAFLLRVATGLESQVVGEADVFGQMKEAWAKRSADLTDLRLLFQRLFEDTKEVRTHYLQNLGASSYGGVLRKVLDRETIGTIGFLGAGKIIQSVLPWLKNHELVLWNRSEGRLSELVQNSKLKKLKFRAVLSGLETEEKVWRSADHMVIGIPADDEMDPARILAASLISGKVFHLGGERKELPLWDRALGKNLFALDDLYAEIQKSQSVRDLSIQRARNACWERSKLRIMGGSLSIPHGWEDLAVFS